MRLSLMADTVVNLQASLLATAMMQLSTKLHYCTLSTESAALLPRVSLGQLGFCSSTSN